MKYLIYCFGFFLAFLATKFVTENPSHAIDILGMFEVARGQLGIFLGFSTVGVWMFGVGTHINEGLYEEDDSPDPQEDMWNE